MTKRTRWTLFIIITVLFFITAPLVMFYSLGWRFDWETKKITQPGIFYFTVYPKNAEVYLNGKLEKKTDFFFGAILIENLKPKKYDVEIKKNGFHTWKKTLEIEKLKATEAKNIILMPINPTFTSISNNVERSFLSPDQEKILIKEKNSFSLKLIDLDTNIKSNLIESDRFNFKEDEEVAFTDLKFSLDSKRILLELQKEKPAYYILNTDKIPSDLISLDFLDAEIEIERIDFNPNNLEKLFVLINTEERKTLNEIDLIRKQITSPILEDIITYTITEDSIYYINASGFLFKSDLSLNKRDKLNIAPFSFKEANYEIAAYGNNVLLKENQTLYIIEDSSFKQISEHVQGFKFSSDSRKLAYFNDYEIWILFIEEQLSQPQKQKGEQLFLTRFSDKIENVSWLTNHYLIFNAKDKIKVIETDDRDSLNIIDFAEFENPELFWNWDNKNLYVSTNGNLYVLEELIP